MLIFSKLRACIIGKKIIKENETVSLIKFDKTKIEEVEKRIKELHPYEVPCIMRIPADANIEFEKWINSQEVLV